MSTLLTTMVLDEAVDASGQPSVIGDTVSLSDNRVLTSTDDDVDDSLTTLEQDLWLGLDSAIAYITDVASEMAQRYQHQEDDDATNRVASVTTDCPSTRSDPIQSTASVTDDPDIESNWIDAVFDTGDMFGLVDAVNSASSSLFNLATACGGRRRQDNSVSLPSLVETIGRDHRASINNSISLWEKDEQGSLDVTVIQRETSVSPMDSLVDHQTSPTGCPDSPAVFTGAACLEGRSQLPEDSVNVDLLEAVEKLCAELDDVVAIESLEARAAREDCSELQLSSVLSERDLDVCKSPGGSDKQQQGHESGDRAASPTLQLDEVLSDLDQLSSSSTWSDNRSRLADSSADSATNLAASRPTVGAGASEISTSLNHLAEESGSGDPMSVSSPQDQLVTSSVDAVSADLQLSGTDVQRQLELASEKLAASKSPTKSPSGRIVVVSEVPPVSVVKFRPVAAKEYFNVNHADQLNHGVVGNTHHESSACVVEKQTRSKNTESLSANSVPPPMAPSSCLSTRRHHPSDVEMAASRHPLSQLYGVTSEDAGSSVTNQPSSNKTTPTAPLNRANSSAFAFSGPVSTNSASVQPLAVTSDTSGVMSNIRLARSCSRHSVSGRPPMRVADGSSGGGVNEDEDVARRRRLEQYRGGVVSMVATDWRSTPWLPTAGTDSTLSQPSFYFPSQTPPRPVQNGHLSRASTLRMSMSTNGLQWMSSSSSLMTPTSSLTSLSPSQTPTASRYSSSIISNDGSTLHARSTLNDSDSLRGSLSSLNSMSSSVCSTADDKQAHQIRKLKQELEVAHEKMESLGSQLNANSLIVTSYEQSVTTLTKKLKQLAEMVEKKDAEVNELRAAMKHKVSADIDLETIPDCVSVGSTHRKSSSTLPSEARTTGIVLTQLSRHISCESVDSMNSQSSANSMSSHQSAMVYGDKKKHKKKNWIKNSLAKAFSMSKKSSSKPDSISVTEADSISIQSDISGSDFTIDSVTSPPAVRTADCFVLDRPLFNDLSRTSELEEQLHQREVELTESRLQSLASFQQIEQLQDTVSSLEQQVSFLKSENRNLKRLLLRQGSFVSIEDDASSVGQDGVAVTKQQSAAGRPVASRCLSLSSSFHSGVSPSSPGPLLAQKYSLGDLNQDFESSADFIRNIKVTLSAQQLDKSVDQMLIGDLSLTRLTSWRALDAMVVDVFLEYVHQIDPSGHLGLNVDSILGFKLFDITRMFNSEAPDLLPANHISDFSSDISIEIIVKGWQENCLDDLVLETLAPKSSLQQYVSLLMECRRLVFCGPTGTGKTFLASRIAKHVVQRCKKAVKPSDIVTFAIDSMSVRDLQQYIARIVRQCDSDSVDASQLPTVLVVDNLQHVSSLSDVFSGFLACKSPLCPYFVATMNQTKSPSAADLQLRQNFRWVLLSSPLEPVSGLLSRCLRRRIIHTTLDGVGGSSTELNRVADWLMQVWQHVNKFIYSASSSSSFSIGPAQFLSCPMDIKQSQLWFTDLWNNAIMPYIVQVVKETCARSSSGASNGHRSSLEDPTSWVLESYPWSSSSKDKAVPPLVRLDRDSQVSVSYPVEPASTSSTNSSSSSDPLLTMLMKLQEVSSCPTKPMNGNVSTCFTNSTGDLDLSRYSDNLAAVGSAVS